MGIVVDWLVDQYELMGLGWLWSRYSTVWLGGMCGLVGFDGLVDVFDFLDCSTRLEGEVTDWGHEVTAHTHQRLTQGSQSTGRESTQREVMCWFSLILCMAKINMYFLSAWKKMGNSGHNLKSFNKTSNSLFLGRNNCYFVCYNDSPCDLGKK